MTGNSKKRQYERVLNIGFAITIIVLFTLATLAILFDWPPQSRWSNTRSEAKGNMILSDGSKIPNSVNFSFAFQTNGAFSAFNPITVYVQAIFNRTDMPDNIGIVFQNARDIEALSPPITVKEGLRFPGSRYKVIPLTKISENEFQGMDNIFWQSEGEFGWRLVARDNLPSSIPNNNYSTPVIKISPVESTIAVRNNSIMLGLTLALLAFAIIEVVNPAKDFIYAIFDNFKIIYHRLKHRNNEEAKEGVEAGENLKL